MAALRCGVVCGSANNQLSEDALGRELAAHGVLYAPDFIANAGGLIHVYADLRGHDPALVDDLVDSIGTTVSTVLGEAAEREITPLEAARELARRRLEAGAAVQAA